MTLNPKHKQFADFYLSDPTRNAREAYLKVYPKAKPRSADTKASALLKKVDISDYVDFIEKKTTEKVELSIEWVKEKLKRFSEAKITNYFEFDDNGNVKVKNLTSLPPEIVDCIQEIQQTKDGIKIKLVDKKTSVTDIGRHFGAFTDNLNVKDKTFEDILRLKNEQNK